MKITIISGSPHKEGTSAVLVNEFIKGAESQGHSIYRFDAAFRNVSPCMARETCLENGGNCVRSDDMEELCDNIIDSDAVVFASPVYYNDICGQLKIVIDRFFAKDERMKGPKKTALLLSMGDDTMDTIKGIVYNFKAMSGYFGWKPAGLVAALGCSTAEDVKKTEFPARARELGKEVGK